MLNFSKKVLVSFSIVTAVAISSYAGTKVNPILDAYSNIALDNYSDTLKDAKALKTAIDEFAKKPTQENLDKAKKAWLDSRESYGQSEAFICPSNAP